MNDTAQHHFIRTGTLLSVAWKLSVPAVLAMVLYGLNALADLIFIGQFCDAHTVAGASIAANFGQLTMGFGSLVGVGIGTVLSIAIGARDSSTLSRITGNLNALSLIFAAVVGGLGWLLAEPFMSLMGAQGNVLTQGLAYYRICLVGTPFIIHGVGLNMVVRAEGKMGSAAIMMALGLGMNLLCNALFMGVFRMGLAGAAWGTNIGMLVYSIAGLVYLARGKAGFPGKPFSFHLDTPILAKALGNGMPSLIMSVMTLLQALVIYQVLAKQGNAFDQAFYGVTFRIVNFMLTPVFGLMRALQPVVGINYGAQDIPRVKGAFKTFLILATLLVLPFWGLMMIFPAQAMGTMLPGIALQAQDLLNFRMGISVLPLLPVMFMAMTFYPAIGKGGPVAALGMARQVVLYIPLMLILPTAFGLPWIYLGGLLIDLFLIVVVVFMVLQEFQQLDRLHPLRATPAARPSGRPMEEVQRIQDEASQ